MRDSKKKTRVKDMLIAFTKSEITISLLNEWDSFSSQMHVRDTTLIIPFSDGGLILHMEN